MSNQDMYAEWRRLIAGEAVTFHPDHPYPGFYRIKNRDKSNWQAVAYWIKDGALRCRVDSLEVEDMRAKELWNWACRNPITHELYKAVLGGAPWPDISEAVENSNNAPSDDSFEGIRDAFDALKREAEDLLKKGAAKTRTEADSAANLVDRIAKLQKRADGAREKEKAPFLQGGRDVDNKWRSIIAETGIFSRIKQVVLKPFLDAAQALKEKREAEARALAEQAAKKAREAEELAQREAEAAARAGNEDAEAAAHAAFEAAQVEMRKAAEAKQAADIVSAQRVTVGTLGRSVHLRSAPEFTIGDRKAMLAYFEDRDELTDLLLKMAKAAHRAGIKVPGLTVTEDSKAA